MKSVPIVLVTTAFAVAAIAAFLIPRADKQPVDAALESEPPALNAIYEPLVAATEDLSMSARADDSAVSDRVLESASGDESLSVPDSASIELSPEQEVEVKKRRVRMFLDQNLNSDQGVEALMNKVRAQPEDIEFAEPIRKYLAEVLARSMPEKFDAGELYWECGSELCFVEGVSHEATLNRISRGFRSALNENGVQFASGQGHRTENGEWVYFIIGANYAL